MLTIRRSIVEQADRNSIFDHPQHQYAYRLLSAIPALNKNNVGVVELNGVWKPREYR
jgi:oligopeptide/dipeptide ABC transporter ATP-binding protein